MIVNHEIEENKSKIKRVITEKATTRPDTVNNCNFGYNNLNSVLKNVDDDRVVHYIKIPKTETAKIEDNIIKEISNSNDNSKNEKICLNTNINKNNKQNLDLYFLPKRVDRFGSPITKGGKKHKVTFIDKITKKNFADVIKIESFKEENKMEEITDTKKNNCCLIS